MGLHHHHFVAVVLVTLGACVPDRQCGLGQVPNDLLQACVTLPPCDGGVINERNQCMYLSEARDASAGDAGMSSGMMISSQRHGGAGQGVLDAGLRAAANVGGSGGQVAPTGGDELDAGAGKDAEQGTASTAPVCGNGVREGNELCDGADCKTKDECTSDNACIPSRLEGSAATCDAHCVSSSEIAACSSGDKCCPVGCDYGTDTDCSPSCGDGELTGTETCEPGSADHPCPTLASCDDHDPCTDDMITGSAQACSAKCAHKQVTEKIAGDKCCPNGANANDDSDCKAECGNKVVEPGEVCDGDCPTSCDDGNACTNDELVGSASLCNAQCRHGSGKMNACGGCGLLDHSPGSECTATQNSCVSKGQYECQGSDSVRCNASTPTGSSEKCDGSDNDCDGRVDEGVKNTCGGCTSLKAAPGAACFAEGPGCTNQGKYECDGTDALRCTAAPCLCGNGVVDPGETCDVTVPGGNPGSCPTTCTDNDPCTNDRKVGSLCSTACLYVPTTGCNPGDPPSVPANSD